MLEDFTQSQDMAIDFPLLPLLIDMLQLSGCLHLTWVPFSTTTTSIDSFKIRNLDSTQDQLSNLSLRSRFVHFDLKLIKLSWLGWVEQSHVWSSFKIMEDSFFLSQCILVSLLYFIVFYFSFMFVSVVTCLTVVMVTKRYFRMWLDFGKGILFQVIPSSSLECKDVDP